MALRVWLPLDGDLRNNGTLGVTITNNGATINASGKIGQCYQFDNSSSYIDLNHSELYNILNGSTQPFSICVWVYHADTSRAIIFGDYSVTGGKNFNIELTTDHTLRWYWGTPDIRISAMNVDLNIWTHITFTYSGTVLKGYVNGIEKYTNTVTLAAKNRTTGSYYLGRDGRTGTTTLNGKLNDFRIYNHCLSAAEVHEIAQGLVLHYKLDGGVTTAKNLIKNGYGELGTTNWNTSANFSSEVPPNHPEIKKSIYSNTTIEYIPIENTHSYKLEAYLKNSATSGNTYPTLYPYDIDKNFIYVYNCPEGFNLSTMTFLTQELKSGDTKIYVNDLSKWNANSGTYYNYAAIFNYNDSTGYVYPNGTYTRDTPAFGSSNTAKTNLDKTNNIITLNSAYSGPTKPVGTAICAATAGNTNYYPFGGLAKSSLNDWTYKTVTMTPDNIARLKYAKYIHYSTYDGTLHAGIKLIDLADDIDSTIISDSSGYGHNGEIIGDLIPSSDTKRYSASTRWNCSSPTDNSETGICYIQTPFTLTTPLQLTVAWWAKPESGYNSVTNSAFCTSNNASRPTDYNRTAFHHRDSGFDIYPSDGSGVKRLSFTYIKNEWHHYAITYDGTTAKSYKDGVLQTSVDVGTNKTLATFSQLYIGYSQAGGVKRKTLGNYSDFRIYCTPLLDTDIKLLYNIGSRIDNLGGVHSFELEEKDNNLLAGTLITSAFNNKVNPYTKYNSNGEMYFDTNGTSAGSSYISINPTNHTYYYDFDISVNAGNQFYIGFERYDADKTSRSNAATVYVYTTKATEDVNHKHIFGTVNLSTDGVNPCAFIALRILNGWSGTNSGVVGAATIHSMSLREISTIQNPKSYKNGILLTGEFKEYQKASFYKSGFVEATEFIEI